MVNSTFTSHFKASAVAATVALALAPAFIPQVAGAAELPRSHVTLASAVSVDAQANIAVLPLHHGTANGKSVYYILTESSDKAQATALGLNYAPNLGKAYVQHVTGTPDALAFAGAPDFSPARLYVPSATGFPPANAKPGAVADDAYSPFAMLPNGTTLGASIVATGDSNFDVTTHANTAERLLAISLDRKTATLLLAHGFVNGKSIVYLSTDASDPGVASIERATFTKNLFNSAPASKTPILALANGQTGNDNAQAQGLAHVALDGNLNRDATLASSETFGSPLNVLSVFNAGPPAAGYTPLWDANVGVWSKTAVADRTNVRLTSLASVFGAAGKGLITSPDGKTFGPSGFVVNCPIVGYVEGAP